MPRPVNCDTLRYAARTQRAFGYLVGVIGSATGAVLLVQGFTLMAAVLWAATFVFGIMLVGLGMVLDGLAAVLERTSGPNEPPTVDGRPA
ncbi:MAG: hypothetical protein WD360_03595 [Nitriliruptoraceae bacterium]